MSRVVTRHSSCSMGTFSAQEQDKEDASGQSISDKYKSKRPEMGYRPVWLQAVAGVCHPYARQASLLRPGCPPKGEGIKKQMSSVKLSEGHESKSSPRFLLFTIPPSFPLPPSSGAVWPAKAIPGLVPAPVPLNP